MATFPTMADLRGLPDPLLQYRWTLIVPNVPGGGDGRRLQYQCRTAAIPGLTDEKQTTTSHGVDLHWMGRTQFGGSFAASFFETRDMVIFNTIRAWKLLGRDPRAGSGSYKADYATTAQLLLLDDTLKVVKTVNMDGFFPTEMGEASLDGASSAPVEFSVTFSFDSSFDS